MYQGSVNTALSHDVGAAILNYFKILRFHDGDGNENVKKAIVLISKTTTLHGQHTSLYISLPPLHDYDVKMHVLWRTCTSDDKILSLSDLGYRFLIIHLQKIPLAFEKVS